jgi:hypothetical protein
MLREVAGTYACSLCPLLLLSRGARATHENACRRKIERKRAQQDEHDAEVLLRAQGEFSAAQITHRGDALACRAPRRKLEADAARLPGIKR